MHILKKNKNNYISIEILGLQPKENWALKNDQSIEKVIQQLKGEASM
jgi:hypothetical protein